MTDSTSPIAGETPYRDFLLFVIDARSLVEMSTSAAHFTVHVNSRMRETYEQKSADAAQEHDAGSIGKLASTAAKEIASGFPMLHAHTLVGLWGALEACIDGMCEEWLRLNAGGSQPDGLARLKISLGDYLSRSAEERWRWVLDELKRSTASDLKRGVGQFDSILDAIGLDGPLDPDVRAVLHQAKTLRNVVAHRGGRIDAKFRDDYPDVDAVIGESVSVTGPQLVASYTAMVYFVDSVWARMKQKMGIEPHTLELPPWVESMAALRLMMQRGGEAAT